MDVKDGLSGTGAIVKDHAEPLGKPEISGKSGAGAHHPADQLLIFGLQEGRSHDMFFGDDQKMDGRLGRDIPEGQEFIIFIELVRGDLAADDLTEETVFIHDFFSYRSGRIIIQIF